MRIGGQDMTVQHSLRLGDRVYQRLNPWNQGTVTKLDSISFRVSYDSYGRKPGNARLRVTYPSSASADFLVGKPNPDLLIWEKEMDNE